MQHSLLINSLLRAPQLIWAAWFSFRLNQMSLQGFWWRWAIMFAHCFSWGRCIYPIGLQVPSFTICTVPPPPLNKHIVKHLQVFVADIFNSYIYESKCWGWQSLFITSGLWLSSYHGKLVSNLPCDKEISQGYDQHQAFHDSVSLTFL